MFGRFKYRDQRLERLDTGDYSAGEYAKWHREMWYIHRLFGEFRALRGSLLSEIGSADRVSVLDVGAGSGELLRVLRRWLGGRATLLAGAELNQLAVKAIKATSPEDRIDALQCDALMLPFADDSFDYVFCSLFMHHLTDEAAIQLLREMKRVALVRIFVIDLHRHPIAYYFYRAAARLFLQPFSRDDGSLSILRSFKPAEMVHLAEKAGLEQISVRRSAAYRLVLSGS